VPSARHVTHRVKLRDLRILLAVAKSGSMGKAAADLVMSQPVISKAISDLETVLGLRLLDRSPRGVQPTMYGDVVVKWAIAIFDDLRQGISELGFLTDPTAGELRIGCTEPLAAGFVPTVIERLTSRYPGLVFRVIPADSTTLKNRELPQRNIDVAVATVTPGPNKDRDIDVQVLFDDRFVVVAGSQSQWARRRNIALSDLIEETWVLPPPDSIMGTNIAAAFRAAGMEPPRARAISFSIPLHHHLVATGQFITVLPVSMLRLGKHVPLKPLSVKMPKVPRRIGIMTLKNRTLGPLAYLFIETAKEIAKPLAKTH
jgi:DNA-binding transcriptional LysR family regulator